MLDRTVTERKMPESTNLIQWYVNNELKKDSLLETTEMLNHKRSSKINLNIKLIMIFLMNQIYW